MDQLLQNVARKIYTTLVFLGDEPIALPTFPPLGEENTTNEEENFLVEAS